MIICTYPVPNKHLGSAGDDHVDSDADVLLCGIELDVGAHDDLFPALLGREQDGADGGDEGRRGERVRQEEDSREVARVVRGSGYTKGIGMMSWLVHQVGT